MFSRIFILLCLTKIAFSTALENQYAQKPLSEAGASSSFISNSIFGPRRLDTQQFHVPETLPPSFFVNAGFDNGGVGYSGIATFAHLPYTICTKPESEKTFDIGIVGHPFDLGVSYRPGARFGPNGARQGARRLSPVAGWDLDHNRVNPFRNWASVVDCGDISNAPFDKMEAIHELEVGMKVINSRTPKNYSVSEAVRLITIGGDHTITLPILRALHSTWGTVAVLHFDSHLDTWDPKQLGGGVTKYAEVNHGTMLHIAHEEGLLSNNSNMHLGSRCSLLDEHYDLNNDLRCGFGMIRARELDKLGIDKIVQKVVDTVGEQYVYLSVDIDVLDPAFAPATGTIEPGGWTTRELLAIIQGLSNAGLKIVGSDVVEFTPIYDNAAETTGIVVGDIVYEILHWMVQVPVKKPD